MRHYKNIHTLLMCLLVLFATGCASHDDAPVQSVTDEGNHLRLKLGMAVGTASRATSNPQGGENGDGNEVGLYNENNIYHVYLYVYSSAQGINASPSTPVRMLAYDKDVNFRPTASDVNPSLLIEKELDFNVGTYRYKENDHFIVAVNSEMLSQETTLGRLRDALIDQTLQRGTTAKDCDRFVMANASDSRHIGGLGTKDDPFVIGIDVERLSARIDFAYSQQAMADGRFSIGSDGTWVYKVEGSGDEVHISHVRVTNAMRSASYLIKRLARTASDAPDYLAEETNPATKYVVEPTTWLKGSTDENDAQHWFSYSRYSNAVDTYDTTWFGDADRVHTGTGDAFTDGTSPGVIYPDWRYYVLDYVNENTMEVDNTLHTNTTGLILKGTYLPEKVYRLNGSAIEVDATYTKGTTFWRWHDLDTNDDIFFSTEADAMQYQTTRPHSMVFPYVNAQCYYNVWLRHENIVDDPTTTMMEFGIVRNNIYRVCVSFTGIGSFDVPDGMDTPETIRMFIYVRKWNLINHPMIEI